jgi:hypothetical protein
MHMSVEVSAPEVPADLRDAGPPGLDVRGRGVGHTPLDTRFPPVRDSHHPSVGSELP